MRSTLTKKDLTGSATSVGAGDVYKIVAGPMLVAGARSWTVAINNYGDDAMTGVKVEVSNDLTETAASIVDWFNLNADIPGGDVGVVIPGTLAATTTAMFAGISPCYVTRWVRVQALAADAAQTDVRAAIHAIF